jgi:hypothetical protein
VSTVHVEPAIGACDQLGSRADTAPGKPLTKPHRRQWASLLLKWRRLERWMVRRPFSDAVIPATLPRLEIIVSAIPGDVDLRKNTPRKRGRSSMLIRCAFFEGHVREGKEAAFEQFIEQRLMPLWRRFPGATDVRVCTSLAHAARVRLSITRGHRKHPCFAGACGGQGRDRKIDGHVRWQAVPYRFRTERRRQPDSNMMPYSSLAYRPPTSGDHHHRNGGIASSEE